MDIYKKKTVLKTLLILLAITTQGFAQETKGKSIPNENEFRYTNPITRDTAIAMRDHCILRQVINGIV